MINTGKIETFDALESGKSSSIVLESAPILFVEIVFVTVVRVHIIIRPVHVKPVQVRSNLLGVNVRIFLQSFRKRLEAIYDDY